MSDDLPGAPPSTVDLSRTLRRGRARPRLRRMVRIGLGVWFLVLGVLGLFLPILQGVLFLVIGATLLAPDIPVFRRLLLLAYRRWPRIRRAVPKRWRRMGRGAVEDVFPEAPTS